MDSSYTEARHTGFAGNVLWELGMHGQFVTETRNRLSAAAVAARVDGRARTSPTADLCGRIGTVVAA